MIKKIEITGIQYKIDDDFRKYATKRISKLDRFLPKESRQDPNIKLTVREIKQKHGNKYELSANIELTGGKVLTAKEETTTVFTGIDLLEAKLMGQIRRLKSESKPRSKKNLFTKLFIKRS